jgi:hypothetical protein
MNAQHQITSANGSESCNAITGGRTRKKPGFELLIPSWPLKTGEAFHGDVHSGGVVPECDSFRIPLRCREIGDEMATWLSAENQDWHDFSIYVWHCPSSVNIRIEVHQLHSADLRKLERLTKKLKWVEKKLENFSNGNMDRLLFTLVDLCQRLGIKRSVQYGHCADTFVPVLEALIPIVKQAELRATQYRRSYAA